MSALCATRLQQERLSDLCSGCVRLYASAVAMVLALGALCSCRSAESPRTELVLGTVCTVNAFRDGSDALYDELFARLSEIDRDASATGTASQVQAVNAASGVAPVTVGADVFAVTQAALRVAEQTGGAFNPAVGPLVALWGIATEGARVPSAAEIAEARALCDWRDIELDETARSIFLKKRGMRLDLGGIAKGYAADELSAILRARGVRRAVISLGGNVYLFGRKRGSRWRVGIRNPLQPDGEAALALELSEASVVTSGVYERFFEQDGVRYHHILDTATGAPARTGLLSVTVVCNSSLLADALATALFVLGMERGFALLVALPEAQAVFIAEDGTVMASAGLSCTALTDDYTVHFR